MRSNIKYVLVILFLLNVSTCFSSSCISNSWSDKIQLFQAERNQMAAVLHAQLRQLQIKPNFWLCLAYRMILHHESTRLFREHVLCLKK